MPAAASRFQKQEAFIFNLLPGQTDLAPRSATPPPPTVLVPNLQRPPSAAGCKVKLDVSRICAGHRTRPGGCPTRKQARKCKRSLHAAAPAATVPQLQRGYPGWGRRSALSAPKAVAGPSVALRAQATVDPSGRATAARRGTLSSMSTVEACPVAVPIALY